MFEQYSSKNSVSYKDKIADIFLAKEKLNGVVNTTPLLANQLLSKRYNANILLKREDLQIVRSYKIRGAYNKISSLSNEEISRGVVCASAGNHAQGVAYSCSLLKISGKIFMPVTTPQQKINQVKLFGGDFIEIELVGDTYDETSIFATQYCKNNNASFIHPFDDEKVISGQGTIGLEILQQMHDIPDYIFLPIGGGGLASGVGAAIKSLAPDVKIIGVEPEGAAAMSLSIKNGVVTELEEIDKFVDGAAVQKPGERTFEMCRKYIDDFISVPEGKVCTTILELYNLDALVVEPAGALSITALDFYKEEIKNRNVVCIVSGSNNDITRTEEIKERSMLYEGLKHYFIIRFPQRAGALKQFVNDVLGNDDNITLFEYSKKHNREKGPALVGIELKRSSDFEPLVDRMKKSGFKYEYLNNKPDLFQYLV